MNNKKILGKYYLTLMLKKLTKIIAFIIIYFRINIKGSLICLKV